MFYTDVELVYNVLYGGPQSCVCRRRFAELVCVWLSSWTDTQCFIRRRVTAILCLQPRDWPWSPGLPTRHDSSNQTFVNESEVITFPPPISGQNTLQGLFKPLHTHRESKAQQLVSKVLSCNSTPGFASENIQKKCVLDIFHNWFHSCFQKKLAIKWETMAKKKLSRIEKNTFSFSGKINSVYLLARLGPTFCNLVSPGNLHILYLHWHFLHYIPYIVTFLATFDVDGSFLTDISSPHTNWGLWCENKLLVKTKARYAAFFHPSCSSLQWKFPKRNSPA